MHRKQLCANGNAVNRANVGTCLPAKKNYWIQIQERTAYHNETISTHEDGVDKSLENVPDSNEDATVVP